MGETECLLRLPGHCLRRPQLEAKVHFVRGTGGRARRNSNLNFWHQYVRGPREHTVYKGKEEEKAERVLTGVQALLQATTHCIRRGRRREISFPGISPADKIEKVFPSCPSLLFFSARCQSGSTEPDNAGGDNEWDAVATPTHLDGCSSAKVPPLNKAKFFLGGFKRRAQASM